MKRRSVRERRPVELGAGRCDQAFIGQHCRELLGCGEFPLATQHNPMTDSRTITCQFDCDVDEAGIEKHRLVIAVIRDVGDLFVEQARIDRMTDHARARHSVIEFQMPVRVPGQGANTRTGRQAKRSQCMGRLPGALSDGPVVKLQH